MNEAVYLVRKIGKTAVKHKRTAQKCNTARRYNRQCESLLECKADEFRGRIIQLGQLIAPILISYVDNLAEVRWIDTRIDKDHKLRISYGENPDKRYKNDRDRIIVSICSCVVVYERGMHCTHGLKNRTNIHLKSTP